MEETKSTQKLTLQQKFVALRLAIPAIEQKKHSSAVPYKFAKIFDVYQLLTPAMNDYGVNFDIIEEIATRHAENGDDIYFHSYEQKTSGGYTRTVWVYEADLLCRWTNADDPTDAQEVKLHAIGTNDSGPDKAKGSAWTYCLKYYFFEKFGIDQGEDDPDNVPAQTFQPAPIVGGGAKENGPKLLSDAQLQRMYAKGEAAGYKREQVDQSIAKKYGQPDPRKLTKEQYEEVCTNLDKLKNEGEKK